MDQNAVVPYIDYLRLNSQEFGQHFGPRFIMFRAMVPDHTVKEVWAGKFPQKHHQRKKVTQENMVMRFRCVARGYLISF